MVQSFFDVPPPSAIENLVENLFARDLMICRIESLLNSRVKFLRAGDPGQDDCEWQLCLARPYRILAEVEAEAKRRALPVREIRANRAAA